MDGRESLFIDYSGAKYARFTPKIAAMQKSLFRVVENEKFLNRLRNGHLEKPAVTGIFRPSRSPTTAKTPLKVHLRLRFQNLGKPRTAGLCGRAVGACDCGPLSCFLFRPRKRLEKRRKRSHINASNASVIRTSRVSQTSPQTPPPKTPPVSPCVPLCAIL